MNNSENVIKIIPLDYANTIPIQQLNLKFKINKLLIAKRINNVGDLNGVSIQYLRSIDGIGEIAIKELLASLKLFRYIK